MGSESASAEFERFVARERRTGRYGGTLEPLASGEITERLVIQGDEVSRYAVEAAKRASGLFRPTRRTEAVWVDGDSELAVGIAGVRVDLRPGALVVTVPVRCDQTGRAEVFVTFAVGEPGRPAGLYATAQRRPRGPAIVVDTWGEAIVAFAWHVVLELVSGLAGATGKDTRGNRLVPAELEVTPDGLAILPMARHRFFGSPGLRRGTT